MTYDFKNIEKLTNFSTLAKVTILSGIGILDFHKYIMCIFFLNSTIVFQKLYQSPKCTFQNA